VRCCCFFAAGEAEFAAIALLIAVGGVFANPLPPEESPE
jgi:hypothetical protein